MVLACGLSARGLVFSRFDGVYGPSYLHILRDTTTNAKVTFYTTSKAWLALPMGAQVSVTATIKKTDEAFGKGFVTQITKAKIGGE